MNMKRRTTKADIRAAMDREVEDYLAHGGQIDEVAQGISGRPQPEKATPPPIFDEPSKSRTDVSQLLKQIDARKKKDRAPSLTRNRRPKKKLIYDDFGEPLRWVWEE